MIAGATGYLGRHQPASFLKVVNAFLMVEPGALAGGNHTMGVAGNDDPAKAQVAGWLKNWFGWQDVMDLDDITHARGTEMRLAL